MSFSRSNTVIKSTNLLLKSNLSSTVRKRCALEVYGLETSCGIYRIQPKNDCSRENETPEFLKNKKIEIFTPQPSRNVYRQLRDLVAFSSKVEAKSCLPKFNGYLLDNNEFLRAVAYVTDKTNLKDNRDFNVDNVSFYCENDKIFKGTGEEYEIISTNEFHPMFDFSQHRPVYYDYEQVKTALKNLEHLSAVQDILKIYPQLFTNDIHVNINDVTLSNHFIVVEGLDGTGKSTMTKNLSNYFNAVSMATPPDSIRHLRRKFDLLPELCQRSYYALSNYLVSKDVIDKSQTNVVIMDRYWHSTTSYAIAKEAGCGVSEYIPEAGHSLYQWPKDLLRPSAIVYLKTPENHRNRRVFDRSELTIEEKEISECDQLRARIEEVYKRIGYPNWVEVDTSGTQEQSLHMAINKLEQLGIGK